MLFHRSRADRPISSNSTSLGVNSGSNLPLTLSSIWTMVPEPNGTAWAKLGNIDVALPAPRPAHAVVYRRDERGRCRRASTRIGRCTYRQQRAAATWRANNDISHRRLVSSPAPRRDRSARPRWSPVIRPEGSRGAQRSRVRCTSPPRSSSTYSASVSLVGSTPSSSTNRFRRRW
jgi:hypothetical protein